MPEAIQIDATVYAEPMLTEEATGASWGHIEQAEKCPCFSCPARESCIIQCIDFKSYVDGKRY